MRTTHLTFYTCIIFILMLLTASFPQLHAQENPIIITLSLPEFYAQFISQRYLADFEAQHPDVKVVIVETGIQDGGSPRWGLSSHLQTVNNLVQNADVVLIGTEQGNISVEATRAGYYLDLAPLITVDAGLDTSDFYESAMRSFQWDAGFWAFPINVDPYVMMYRRTAFDAIGLSYPDENWTAAMYLSAVEQFAQHDANGEITSSSFLALGLYEPLAYLLRSQFETGFYDASQIPSPPDFSQTDLTILLDQWTALQANGIIDVYGTETDYNSVPLQFRPLSQLAFDESYADTWNLTLLTGGQTGMEVKGLAISAGTSYPEIAYELVKYIAKDMNFQIMFGFALPALIDNPIIAQGNHLSPDLQAVADLALENAIPWSEIRFADYLNSLVNLSISTGETAEVLLPQIENQVLTNLSIAEERREDLNLAVVSPTLTPVLPPDQAQINFGVMTAVLPLPNRERWNQVINEFISQDSRVTSISISPGFGFLPPMTEYDCVYAPINLVNESYQAYFLPLNPLLNSDTDFNADQIALGALEQLSLDDQIYAYPTVLYPYLLHYNANAWNQLNIQIPDNAWDTSAFIDTLQHLSNGDDAVVRSLSPGNEYLLMLIAAYGGLPFDYRSDPSTLGFSSIESMNAIRQVLNLVRDGYIDYRSLSEPQYGEWDSNLSLYADYRGPMAVSAPFEEYENLPFPSGTEYTPVSYEIGASYIIEGSPYAEDCFRWISFLAQHPELFDAVPANTNAMESKLANSFQQSNLVYFPPQYSQAMRSQLQIENYWLNRVFDNYVMSDREWDDIQLEAELSRAQNYILLFRDCVNGLEPNFNPNELENCARAIDGNYP